MAQDAPHARNYPGVSLPTPMKCREVKNDDAALAEGFSNSLGVSASGSHKGLPGGTHPAAQPGVVNPKHTKYNGKTGKAAEAEGKTASIGVSDNGSHKHSPTPPGETIGQRTGANPRGGKVGQRRGANPSGRGPVKQ